MLLVEDAGALCLWEDEVEEDESTDPRVEGYPEARELEGEAPEEYPLKP